MTLKFPITITVADENQLKFNVFLYMQERIRYLMSQEHLHNPYQVIHMSDPEAKRTPGESEEDQLFGSPESEQASIPLQEHEEALVEKDLIHTSEETAPKETDHKESFSAQYIAFKTSFDEQPTLEAKLELAIDFMEASLALGGTPHFRSFWEARRLCLPLFKENISPTLRGQLWTKYSELSKEARRLKEILDEQSAFAVEQIEIAVKALESDITHFDELVEKASLSEDLSLPQALKDEQLFYIGFQKELNILNLLASRINALRKELLRTEMRVRFKNKFFHRLSLAGDHVFPKRKELIKQISQRFIEDVERFMTTHFGDKGSRESLYVLREEIKALQGIAKVLTLNTHSFTLTRTKLSECWDKIKVEEKERKKERAQQKAAYQQNAEEIEKQILSLKESLDNKEISANEAQKRCEDIMRGMRKVELGRDEINSLRDALADLKKIIHDLAHADEKVRLEQDQKRIEQKRAKYNAFKEQIENLFAQAQALSIEELESQRDTLLNEIQDSSLIKNEKTELERLVKPLRDVITEKNEKTLLELSDDDRQSLQQLQSILKQRKERRQEIKNQLEVLRKVSGGSSLDFEKAMSYTTQINEEKERLDKMNQSIVEIEKTIAELQRKIKSKG